MGLSSSTNRDGTGVGQAFILLIGGEPTEDSCCYRENGNDEYQEFELQTENLSTKKSKKANLRSEELEPLPNWTLGQQQIIIDSLKVHPQARENKEYRLRLIMTRTRHQLPEKSVEEIEECYRHLQTARILYNLSIKSQAEIRRGLRFQT